MRKGGGRQKGSAFERDVAKLIIAAFEHRGICKEDCYRTPGSGGHKYAKKEDPGDLVISPRLRKHWPFAVECKFYAKLPMDVLMTPNIKAGLISNWWTQTVTSAGKHIPLLVFRQNKQQAYAMLPCAPDKSTDSAVPVEIFGIRPHIMTRVNGRHVRVVRLKSLLRFYRKMK